MKEADLKPPRILKAAAMGIVRTLDNQIKDDLLFGARVRKVVAQLERDLSAYKAALAAIRATKE